MRTVGTLGVERNVCPERAHLQPSQNVLGGRWYQHLSDDLIGKLSVLLEKLHPGLPPSDRAVVAAAECDKPIQNIVRNNTTWKTALRSAACDLKTGPASTGVEAQREVSSVMMPRRARTDRGVYCARSLTHVPVNYSVWRLDLVEGERMRVLL